MATYLENKAKEAYLDDNFELTIDLYSQAIDMDPNHAELFADRAQANIKLGNFTEAVADANKAIQLDAAMTKAYLRKGTASMKMEEYQTAKAALAFGALLAPGDTRFLKLITECEKHIVLDQPTVAAAAAKVAYRHAYYQKPEEVVVTIFAKGVPTEHVVVEFGEQILSVTIKIPGEDVYRFQPRLFSKIKPESCRYQVLSTKIEIRLAKAEPIDWASLEFTNEQHVVVPRTKASTTVADSGRPRYPSSKSKAKNWDEIEAVKKEEKEEKLDGDAALNKFFREMYQGADEDARRAMSKSFVESNGTVLSTNWNEVGAKKVDGTAPQGMEMKKWEY